MKKYVFPFICVIALSGCAANQTAVSAPELMAPAIVKPDTAVAEIGGIQVMDQYRAITRTESEGLFFGQTDLVFKEFLVIEGQSVKEGDLLALLETEWIEEDIEEQQENIAKMIRENEFANDASVIAIDTVRAEYVKLVRESGLDEESVYKAEAKRKEIAVAELALKHQKERQELTLRQEERKLNELTELLPQAELRAPYDGEICLVNELLPGAPVVPFDSVMYITDKKHIFIEAVLDGGSTISSRLAAKGYYQGKEYELERITLSRQEAMLYSSMRVNPPVRYEILPGQNGMPPLGAFMTVRAISNQAENVLRIPVNALYTDPDLGQYVYLVQDGVNIPTYVTVNLRNDSYAEVTGGLREGDEVYVKR